MLDYENEIAHNMRIQSLIKRIHEKGSMDDMSKLAEETGRLMTKVAVTNLKEAFPNGEAKYEDVKAIVSPIMRLNHAIIQDAASASINRMNEKAGVGLKAVVPDYNAEREEELIRIISERSFADVVD